MENKKIPTLQEFMADLKVTPTIDLTEEQVAQKCVGIIERAKERLEDLMKNPCYSIVKTLTIDMHISYCHPMLTEQISAKSIDAILQTLRDAGYTVSHWPHDHDLIRIVFPNHNSNGK